jgi:hypothetical protein
MVDAQPLPWSARVLSLFAYLGAPIGSEQFVVNVAIGVASVLVAGIVYAALIPLARGNSSIIHAMLLWTGVALFAVGAGLAVVAGRSTAFGESVSTESRFHAFSSLWLMALTGLTALLVAWNEDIFPGQVQIDAGFRRAARTGSVFLLILVSASFVNANVAAHKSAVAFFDYYHHNEGCALNPAQASKACMRVFMYSEPDVERETLLHLQENQQGIYANPYRLSVAGTPPPLPFSEPGPDVSVFACSSEARRRPPGEFSEALISAACQRARGNWWPDQALSLDPLNNRRLCVVEEWERWGKRLIIDSAQWCAIEWFDPELQAVSLVNMESNLVLHAFNNSTIQPYADGMSVRRAKSRD